MKVTEISKTFKIPQITVLTDTSLHTVPTIIRKKDKWLKQRESRETPQAKRDKPKNILDATEGVHHHTRTGSISGKAYNSRYVK